MLIHEHSRGIPRTISVMCDNALVSGMALGRQPVDREIGWKCAETSTFAVAELDVLEPVAGEPTRPTR